MSMTEATVVAPVKKRKARKTRRKRAAPTAPKPKAATGELSGITPVNCAAACGETGCVISCKAYCAHPYKGGLQGLDKGNSAAAARLDAAKKVLGEAKINLEKV